MPKGQYDVMWNSTYTRRLSERKRHETRSSWFKLCKKKASESFLFTFDYCYFIEHAEMTEANCGQCQFIFSMIFTTADILFSQGNMEYAFYTSIINNRKKAETRQAKGNWQFFGSGWLYETSTPSTRTKDFYCFVALSIENRKSRLDIAPLINIIS